MPQFPVFDSFSVPYVEELYRKFLANADSVGAEWKAYFLGFTAGASGAEGQGGQGAEGGSAGLARAWRERGHLVAWVNPLADKAPEVPAELKASAYGVGEQDEEKYRRIYGDKIGVEVAAVREPVERAWVEQWWEAGAEGGLARAEKLKMYEGLVKAGALEQFLHKKFVGAKRFSVEGVDGMIPLLGRLIEAAAAEGVTHVTVGMAHRGRLNVLCNIFHKSLAELFAAFGDKLTAEGGPSSGDVKYHLGKKHLHKAENGKTVALELMFNPSHLEAVNPVVLGAARGVRDSGGTVLPVLIHGDSAVAGQGVVAECNNMMGTAGYDVGGVLHIVANNQIGFTADVQEAGGGFYSTEIFKSLGVPIVHVNADDMEACWKAVRFAWAYRQKFGKDAVVDVIGYRRWGHNEGDDPTFTQPVMYAKIRGHKTPAEIYAEKLLSEGFDERELKKIEEETAGELEGAFAAAMKGVKTGAEERRNRAAEDVVTVAESGDIRKVAEAWGKVPAGFVVNDKVGKVVEERVAMLRGEKPLNWGAAETTAYGVLALEGVTVRISGQDAQRGTFSHRHAVLTGAGDNAKWNVLDALAKDGARVEIINSVLSENAVMGFEYGYALARPEKSLVIWEGQFGDFANGAQVVADQFLAAAEAKWGQLNGLTLLLPHGMEGQGPEHSSARLERYLQLCAEDNMRVCYPSTPAQIFHLLRRQAKHPVKKPLVVMTPKSGLRNPATVSALSDLLTGGWQPVLGDKSTVVKERGKSVKVVVCSGKIYYELAARREADKRGDVVLVRLEQLYPWPEKELAAEMAKYKARDVYWVQEEPKNMGAWSHVREYWNSEWGYLHYLGRPAGASPAVGTTVRHTAEQKALVDEVFG